jgi:hypothetical protein
VHLWGLVRMHHFDVMGVMEMRPSVVETDSILIVSWKFDGHPHPLGLFYLS